MSSKPDGSCSRASTAPSSPTTRSAALISVCRGRRSRWPASAAPRPENATKARALAGLGTSIGEAGVAEPGADRHRSPAFDIAHERHFAEPLHDGIVVHDDGNLVTVDGGHRLAHQM